MKYIAVCSLDYRIGIDDSCCKRYFVYNIIINNTELFANKLNFLVSEWSLLISQ